MKASKKLFFYLEIIAFHMVEALDDCEEIINNGLTNLQEVLGQDTIFSNNLSMQFLYVKDNVSIPPSQIVRITEM